MHPGPAEAGFQKGRHRDRRQLAGDVGKRGAHAWHSLPGYYGGYVALWCVIPAVTLLALWIIFEPIYIQSSVIASLPEDLRNLPPERLGLVFNDIQNLVEGNIVSSQPDESMLAAAQYFSDLRSTSRWILTIALAAIASAAIV